MTVSPPPADLSRLWVAATVTSGFRGDPAGLTAWLAHAQNWAARGAHLFAAVQTAPATAHRLAAALARFAADGVDTWEFAVADRGPATGERRLTPICAGRNLAQQAFLLDPTATHVLFLDADVTPPADLPDRLLEVSHPVVGGHVPAYCLGGPPVPWAAGAFPPGADVRAHWNTAGCLLVGRAVVRRVRWGWDKDAGATDDPTYQRDAEGMGVGPTWVRHDVVCHHAPLEPWENRS